MSDPKPGVGMNGETDDFAARYDRMVLGGGTGWVIKTVLIVGGLLALVAAGSALLGG